MCEPRYRRGGRIGFSSQATSFTPIVTATRLGTATTWRAQSLCPGRMMPRSVASPRHGRRGGGGRVASAAGCYGRRVVRGWLSALASRGLSAALGSFGHGIGAGFFRPYLLAVGPDLERQLAAPFAMSIEIFATDSAGTFAYHEDNFLGVG